MDQEGFEPINLLVKSELHYRCATDPYFVGSGGVEPPTYRLKAGSSAIELRPQKGQSQRLFELSKHCSFLTQTPMGSGGLVWNRTTQPLGTAFTARLSSQRQLPNP